MRYAAPELAHQFVVRLHAKARLVVQALDRWSEENELPTVIVTGVSRVPSFYPDDRWSWHLVDCAVDLRNRHYSRDQLQRVEAWLRAKCASSEWELITKDHGTGPHIHLAYREFGLRRVYEQKQKKGAEA